MRQLKHLICLFYRLTFALLFDNSLAIVWINLSPSLSNKLNIAHLVSSSTFSWILYLQISFFFFFVLFNNYIYVNVWFCEILPRYWKLRFTIARCAPKVIFRSHFFVALLASDIVPSIVWLNICNGCKACEFSFLQY